MLSLMEDTECFASVTLMENEATSDCQKVKWKGLKAYG